MANSDNGNSFTLGFLVGGIIGAMVGILIAPKSGAETRAELGERSEAWRTTAEELAASVRERVGPTVEVVRERLGPAVEGVRERVSPAVESVRERVTPAVETVREKVGPVVEQVRARGGRKAAQTDGTSQDGASDEGVDTDQKEA